MRGRRRRRCVLEVRDNGPGVPEELREAIFVRGFSTKPEVLGGRGIGLPLVQLICTQRGGRVTVDSPTTATDVPRRAPARAAGATVIGVLVVDDDFMVARIHARSSSGPTGFEVVGTAHNGAEALASPRS